jgi:transposase
MSEQAYKAFFLQPSDPMQQRYETLRSVFVEQQTMQQAAAQFGVHYGTVRKWASEFRYQRENQQPSPFFSNHNAAAPSLPRKKAPSNMPTSKP